jgi:PTH1 family peptidyl-tRNA hydrolase
MMSESVARPAPLLLVGLGNPGDKYLSTRHNVGFMALERLAGQAGASFRQNTKLHGLLAEVGHGATRQRLLMPQTYMNDSGRSIRAALDWFGLDASQVLILVDDMDLPLGRLRLRCSGGAGGHNGLRSAIAHLGGQDFARLRIGIGAPAINPVERKQRTVGHVLGRFSASEQPALDEVLDEVLAGLSLIQRLGYERAGNRLNGFIAPAAAKMLEASSRSELLP